ncbi:MAG: mobilization protein [Lachnospiraceae bacterium]|nr:mobilization protein [Lachnospiraceae bacterium]
MEKRLDAKGRWRNRTVAFRASDEEWDLITTLVKISGLSKREYIMRKLTDREIVVQGNPKVYKALKDQMAIILEELRRLERCSPKNDELLITIQQVAITMKGMKGDDKDDR